MKEYFQKLFQYNAWANSKMLEAVSGLESPPEKIVDRINHIAAAQEVWLSRILGSDDDTQEIHPAHSWETAKNRLDESSEEWTEFIKTMEEDHFSEPHLYKNSRGRLFKNDIKDILVQVVNHSTHHRGQVNLLLREHGAGPPRVDFIFYSREER